MASHSAHDHADHPHAHSHAPKTFGPAFALATVLNLGLVAAQVFYGIYAQSIALIADAGHNFGDALGLLLAWVAYTLARRQPTERYTYGFRSASILAALANSALLLAASGAIAWEAIRRLSAPPAVAAPTVMIVAGAGIAINLLSAWLLRGGGGDLNIRSAFAHMMADAAASLAVVISGALILMTNWNLFDPIVSLLITAVIVWGTWRLLADAMNLSLQAVPAEIEPALVRRYFEQLDGVAEVHDLHVWAMSTTETALTCHLVMPSGAPGGEFINRVCDELHVQFRIDHPTIQIETGEGPCRLAPAHVV